MCTTKTTAIEHVIFYLIVCYQTISSNSVLKEMKEWMTHLPHLHLLIRKLSQIIPDASMPSCSAEVIWSQSVLYRSDVGGWY